MNNSNSTTPLSATKRALVTIRKLKKELQELKQHNDEPIAIVSMAFRLPNGINSPELYWDLLINGKHAMSSMPMDRWDTQAYFSENPASPGKIYVSEGGFIDDVTGFDAALFGIDKQEALSMDPQQRIMLELCWEAFERAAMHPMAAIAPSNDIGVFVGHAANGYARYALYSGDPARINQHSVTGTAPCFAAGRISHVFGLQGPTLTVDTACSSSLVAMHLACQSLRTGECESAIAGGVNLLLSPEEYIYFCKTAALSPNSQCRAFDADADGYVRAEGAGVFVLKRLSDALTENLPILALIRGSAINHDGTTNGITAPNGLSQKKLLYNALKKAAVSPNDVQYIETHGTGTPLGDPIEVNSLGEVLSANRDLRQDSCFIGSCKTNLGHLEAAAGVASIAKVVLALQNKKIPPSINFSTPNPHIDWQHWHLQVVEKVMDWPPSKEGQAIAGISGFGFSGSNAHIILQEAPKKMEPNLPDTSNTLLPIIILLSAHNKKSLQEQIEKLAEFIIKTAPSSADQITYLHNISYTLFTGRAQQHLRIIAVVDSLSQLQEVLNAAKNKLSHDHLIRQSEPEKLSALSDHYSSELIQLCSAWINNQRVDWKAFLPKIHHIRAELPLYRFKHQHYWPKDVAYETLYIPKQQTLEPLPKITEKQTLKPLDITILDCITLQQFVATSLGLTLPDVQSTKGLFELEIGSIDLVKLRFLLEQECGVSISIQNFTGEITWDSLLSQIKNSQTSIQKNSSTYQSAESEQPHNSKKSATKAFELTPLQQAYWVGRKMGPEALRVGSHFYIEIENKSIDHSILEDTWNQLIARHGLLRATISVVGKMNIISQAPRYQITSHNLNTSNNLHLAEYFANIRSRLSHRIYCANEWPMFSLETSYFNGRIRIHLSIDEIICDGASLSNLLHEWQTLVDGKTTLPPLSYDYGDYHQFLLSHGNPETIEKDIKYWCNKAQRHGGKLPSGPTLPKLTGTTSAKRIRLKGMLHKHQWKRLKNRAKELKVSPTTLILTAFSTLLRSSNNGEAHTFILTYFNRLPVHPDVERIVAPIASTNLFIADKPLDAPLSEVCEKYQQQLWQDAEHSSVDGVSILRHLRQQKLLNTNLKLPVVFTSMLENYAGQKNSNNCWATDWSYSVTQTPQVLLDHQLGIVRNTMFFTWDIAIGEVSQDDMENLFRRYQQILVGLSDSSGVDLPVLLAKQGTDLIDQAIQPTDVQQAYLFGRHAFGNNCQIYQEFFLNHISHNKVEQAVNILLERHDMLRAKYDNHGRLNIPAICPHIEVPEYEFKSSEDEAFKNLRQKMSTHSGNPSQWPLFSIAYSELKKHEKTSSVCIHVVIDMLIADWPSIQTIYSELLNILNQDYPKSFPSYGSYANYQKNIKSWQTQGEHTSANKYWEQKLEKLPAVKLKHTATSKNKKSVRLHANLPIWKSLKQQCELAELDIQHVMLAAYGEALRAFVDSSSFSIVVVDFERRLPKSTHISKQQILDTVGDYTFLSWVHYNNHQANFKESVKFVSQQVTQDLMQWPHSGLPVLRSHGPFARTGNAAAMPFVYSRLLNLPSVQLPKNIQQGWGISTTSGVAIDNVSINQGDFLKIHWDIDTAAISESFAKNSFTQYVEFLDTLANGNESFQKRNIFTPSDNKNENNTLGCVDHEC